MIISCVKGQKEEEGIIHNIDSLVFYKLMFSSVFVFISFSFYLQLPEFSNYKTMKGKYQMEMKTANSKEKKKGRCTFNQLSTHLILLTVNTQFYV